MDRANSYLLYLISNVTNNGGAGAKTKLWLKYVTRLSWSNQIETIKIGLKLTITVLYYRINQQRMYLHRNQDLIFIHNHWY